MTNKRFLMTWDTWSAGVQRAYKLKLDLEARIAAGEVLTERDQRMLGVFRVIVERYSESGHRKPRVSGRGRP